MDCMFNQKSIVFLLFVLGSVWEDLEWIFPFVFFSDFPFVFFWGIFYYFFLKFFVKSFCLCVCVFNCYLN